ncbi:MAG: IS1634 family transposase [Terriglobia bacterium]
MAHKFPFVCEGGLRTPKAGTGGDALCAHGTRHRWLCFKWLLDIAELLRKAGTLDWSRIEEMARIRPGAGAAASVAVTLARDLLEVPVPAEAGRILPATSRTLALSSAIREELLSRDQTNGDEHTTLLTLEERSVARMKYRAVLIIRYSRDHRPDCKQVVIALIVNLEGFPLSYETFDGDRTDVTSLEAVMRMVERKYGRARRIWVFDRGIVSEANLAALRKRGGQYLVGTPRSKLKGMERELLQGTWTQVREEVEAQLVPLPGGAETYVLCRSTARREKERAIRRRFSSRMERALARLAQRVEKGQLKDRSKIERRLGKIQERYVQVADLYEADLRQTGGRWVLSWNLIEERRAWREAREGAYLLRTNLEGATVEELWTKYIQLTEAEAAFRALKSELSIRPLFHQLEPRVKAHILVAFLGYSLWVTLKHLLRRKNCNCSPAQALALLATIQSADIVLPTTDGREIRLRRVAALNPEQQRLVTELRISLPDHFNLNFECSVDSALA